MNERRIARIEQQIKERLANALAHEIADPRLGFVSVTRVQVDKEMHKALVYWSILGDEKARALSASALGHAAGFLRREVARVLHTRTVPVLEFRFDESLTGADEMQSLLNDLREEREQREGPESPDDEGSAPPPE